MRIGEIIEVSITDTEFPGMGISEINGRKIYVKGAVTGQTVTAKVSKKKKGIAETKLVNIIKDVDYHKKADCPHFDMCGGCTHLGFDYDKQLEIKKSQVLKLFLEAEISDVNFEGIEKSPQELEYRNKMEFTFGDIEKGGVLTLGMHAISRKFGVVTVDSCLLVDEDYRKILRKTIAYFQNSKLPYYKVLDHEGYLRNLVIRKGKNTAEIMINIVTTSQIDFDMTEYKDILLSLELSGKVVSILHTINNSLSDAVKCDEMKVLYGRDYITEKVLDLDFKINPFSFFQTNTRGAEKLYSIVKDYIGDTKDKTVFDLYCGTGTIGQIVSQNAKKVIGIEIVSEAIDAAKENAALNGLDNCTFIAGDVAKVIKDINEKPDVIILDPPRPGVSPSALCDVVRFDPESIVYVSCNPKTLVKDLAYLIENGYGIEKVRMMDMFPHTPHVETVCLIERK